MDWAYTREDELAGLIDVYVQNWQEMALTKGGNESQRGKGESGGTAKRYDSFDNEWFSGSAVGEQSEKKGKAMMWALVVGLGIVLVIVSVLVVIVFTGLFLG